MKQLVLIRHIKSSWSDPSLADFDRPIKKSRKEDLSAVFAKLGKNLPVPDCILVSASKRTRQTFKVAEKGFYQKFSNCEMVFTEDLYEATAEQIKEVLSKYQKDRKIVWLIGHNPGLTNYCNTYLYQNLDNFPTSGVMIFEQKAHHYQLIHSSFPKQL